MYGEKLDVNPYKILLDEVKWRAGHVEYLRQRISEETEFDDLFEGGFTDEEGHTFPSTEGPLLRRYDAERNMLDKVCALAIRMGIAERYVQLAQLHGQVLFDALRSAFDDPSVQLTGEQRSALVESLKRTITASMNGSNGHRPSPLTLPVVPT